MIISNIKGVRLDSLVACVPSNVVNNEEYAKIHFDDDLTPVIKALGIRERHVAIDKDTTALTMCVEAARKLQRECAFSNTEIGAVIMVTTSPDYTMPNNATYAQYLLDIPRNVAAYDIILVGVDIFTRSDHFVPPAGFGILRRETSGDMSVATEGVTDENGVFAVRSQCAVGFVTKFNAVELFTAVQQERVGFGGAEGEFLRYDKNFRHQV